MKPKMVGIVGGAGPLAGARLLERILTISNRHYGCYRDADYPQVWLNSFPFSDMLTSEKDNKQLEGELSRCLNQLRQQGAEILAIACNTLHNFLEPDQDRQDLIHLPRLLGEELNPNEPPLIFCTSTSKENRLHQNFFACSYPEPSIQVKVDELIDRILRGADSTSVTLDLSKLIHQTDASTLVLGCTELSLYTQELAIKGKKVIDPLEILAQKIVDQSLK